MPSPSSSLATLRPDIADSFEAFDLMAEKAGYIGHQVLPVVNTASQAGTFGKIPLAQLLQNRDTLRAPGSGYSRGDFTFETSTFSCKEHGAEDPVDDREAKMYAEYFDSEVIAAARAYNVVLKNAEQRIASKVFNTTTWTGSPLFTDVSGGSGTNIPWATVGTAVPLTNVEAAVQKVYDNSGLWCNALVINRKVFRNLRNTLQVIDRIASSGAGDRNLAGDVNVAMLAQAFDLDYIIVAGGSTNTATKGQAAAVNQIWSGTFAMVCRVATSNDFREPCIGRTFHWGADGSNVDGTIEEYRDETVRSKIIRVRHDVDEIVLYPQAGHLLKIAA
jgi:hypothetical protein